LLLGKARNLAEPGLFQRLSLAAFLAWVGLGSDGVSSSCYGPQEAFRALGEHRYLALILAVMTAATVAIISASYIQIIELFPSGGGAYLVASKLLSPGVGMVAGCALIVDYVLTIAVSMASGADALFSLLPPAWQAYKLPAALAMLLVLTTLNLRGVRESVVPLVPIFLVFLALHALAIGYAVFSHAGGLGPLVRGTVREAHAAAGQLGAAGVLLLLLRAYALGGGTYTGIEAVSNGLPILQEPRVRVGTRTMVYMATSLALLAGGLIVAYLLVEAAPQPGRTLNAVLFERVAPALGGRAFVTAALLSEALILVVAAQTGFLDGPRVLANMALDSWMPRSFSLLSSRLVTQNGILLLGAASLLLVWLARGSVGFLVVLYSINVFLVFSLSQLGMVRHWWGVRRRERGWGRRCAINGLGLVLTSFVLATVIVVKFHEGGYFTLLVTASLVGVALLVRRHYRGVQAALQRLNRDLVEHPQIQQLIRPGAPAAAERLTVAPPPAPAREGNTAVLLVNGFNGLGVHTLTAMLRFFRDFFQRFVFVQVGVLDAGRFKGPAEIDNLRRSVQADLERYVRLMEGLGLPAESRCVIGTDVAAEVENLAVELTRQYPRSMYFAGQVVFPRGETVLTRLLHNNVSFMVQRRLYLRGIPLVILPVRVEAPEAG